MLKSFLGEPTLAKAAGATAAPNCLSAGQRKDLVHFDEASSSPMLLHKALFDHMVGPDIQTSHTISPASDCGAFEVVADDK